MKSYVLELVEGVSLHAHAVSPRFPAQLKLAKRLAMENGEAAALSGAVNFFWADVDDDGDLTVGAFDEDLLEE